MVVLDISCSKKYHHLSSVQSHMEKVLPLPKDKNLQMDKIHYNDLLTDLGHHHKNQVDILTFDLPLQSNHAPLTFDMSSFDLLSRSHPVCSILVPLLLVHQIPRDKRQRMSQQKFLFLNRYEIAYESDNGVVEVVSNLVLLDVRQYPIHFQSYTCGWLVVVVRVVRERVKNVRKREYAFRQNRYSEQKHKNA